MGKRYADLMERVIANSVLSIENFWNGSPCWEWLGKTIASRNGGGRSYPVMTRRIKGKPRNVRVHRVILTEVKGEKLRDSHVGAHLCNNPFCVNPEHLRRDTQRGNMRQCVEEGRHVSGFAVMHTLRDFDDLECAA